MRYAFITTQSITRISILNVYQLLYCGERYVSRCFYSLVWHYERRRINGQRNACLQPFDCGNTRFVACAATGLCGICDHLKDACHISHIHHRVDILISYYSSSTNRAVRKLTLDKTLMACKVRKLSTIHSNRFTTPQDQLTMHDFNITLASTANRTFIEIQFAPA